MVGECVEAWVRELKKSSSCSEFFMDAPDVDPIGRKRTSLDENQKRV